MSRFPRYQQLSEEMAEAIRGGVLRPGERLPSVRELCAQRGISPATVFHAYGQLEAEGLIEARARSGFFVRALRRSVRPSPQVAPPRSGATPVAISELVFDLLYVVVILHILAVIYYAIFKRERLVPAMVTGYKPWPAGEARPALHFASLGHAAVALAVAAIAVAVLIRL